MWKSLTCTLAATLLIGSAIAQISASGGPIRVTAERSEVLDREKQVILIDDVNISQGDAKLRADMVTLTYTSDDGGSSGNFGTAFGDIKSMSARGGVYYVTPELTATSDTGLYEASTNTITLSGNVGLLRGGDVAKGSVLTIELALGRTTLDGGVNMVITPAN